MNRTSVFLAWIKQTYRSLSGGTWLFITRPRESKWMRVGTKVSPERLEYVKAYAQGRGWEIAGVEVYSE